MKKHLLIESDSGLVIFRDATIDLMVDGNNDNLADDYPKDIDFTTNSGAPIDNTDLVDISSAALTAGAKTELGWYFDFNTAAGSPTPLNGEKGLASPSVFAGTLIFTTFIPSDPTALADTCSASEGSGNAFNFNILTGNASLDWDGDGDVDLDEGSQPALPGELLEEHGRRDPHGDREQGCHADQPQRAVQR